MPDTPFHILLVEDDASVREAVAASLRDEGYVVTTAADGQQAIDAFAPGTDLVIADLMMPHVDGRSLLRWVTQNHPETAVILMTGYGTIPQAVDAIKAGAAAYLTKPLDPGELLGQVRKSLEDKRLRQELSRLRGQLREGWHYRNIIGKSPSMRQGLLRHRSRSAGENHRADLRRIGHRQRDGRPRAARSQPAKGRTVPRPQLRRDPRKPH